MARVQHDLTAVIYDKRGRVLSVGKNSYTKTHRKMAEAAEKVGLPHKQFIHAEADAIFRCKNLDKAYRIFVTRTTKSGYGLAKPCLVCQQLIESAGIKVVEHT